MKEAGDKGQQARTQTHDGRAENQDRLQSWFMVCTLHPCATITSKGHLFYTVIETQVKNPLFNHRWLISIVL